MKHTVHTRQRAQVNTFWKAHKLNGIQGYAYMCEPLQNSHKQPTHSISHTLRHAQTAAGSCRVTLILFFFPLCPVEMFIISNTL